MAPDAGCGVANASSVPASPRRWHRPSRPCCCSGHFLRTTDAKVEYHEVPSPSRPVATGQVGDCPSQPPDHQAARQHRRTVETARKTYHRFGQFSDALARIRERIEREPMERGDLQRICWGLGIPGDFDIAEINWRPDYDHFFYHQLCRRARSLYLFRDEYIFVLETAAVVEAPQLSHATYVFSKPGAWRPFSPATFGRPKKTSATTAATSPNTRISGPRDPWCEPASLAGRAQG